MSPEVVTFETRTVNIDEVTGATIESADGVEIRVATSAQRRAFEEEFLTVLNDGRFVAADIPSPS